MFNNPIISFVSMLMLTGFIGFSISLFFYKTDLLKRILLSPIIGYAIISLTTAYASYAGFGTNQIALPLFITLTLASIAALIIKRKNITVTGELSLKFLIPIILFGLANVAILLAPTILAHSSLLFNDHTCYIAISEYLRDFGYFTPAHSNISFWQGNMESYQTLHYRMGAQFFVSFFAALLQTTHTVIIYPSILGLVSFIFMCSIGSLYLSLRKEKSNIMENIFVLFLSLAPISLNSLNLATGFLPQTVGMILFITLTALIYESFDTEKKHFITIGILFASLVLTYHEITLFYGGGVFILLAFEYFYKKNRNKPLFIKIIITHSLALLLSPLATREFILGIHNSSGATDGWNIPYSLWKYLEMLFGQDLNYTTPAYIQMLIALTGFCGTLIMIYIILKKEFWEKRKDLLQLLITLFFPFIFAIVFYTYLQFDPLTHQLGYSWRVFKVIGWSYWLIPVIAGMATFSYLKENRYKKILTVGLLLLLLPSVGLNIYALYIREKYQPASYDSKNPLDDFAYLAKNKKDYSPANLIVAYQSAPPEYPYLIFSILKDSSVGDLIYYASTLTPSTDSNFYQWINYHVEHDNTAKSLKKITGFFVYPQKSSSVYLFDGFSQREIFRNNHFAWLTSNSGIIKTIVPKGEKAQFSTYINNWQEKTAKVEIMLNGSMIFSSDIGATPIKFTSPILEGGLHKFTVNYYGAPRAPDANEGRALRLMFENTSIASAQPGAIPKEPEVYSEQPYTFGNIITFSNSEKSNYSEYTTSGWSSPEDNHVWTSQKAKMFIPIPSKKYDKDLILSATFGPLIVPGKLDNQIIDVYVNQKKIGKWIASKPSTYTLTIPKEYVSSSLEIAFDIPTAKTPLELGYNEDSRILGIAMSKISISEAESSNVASP